MHRCKGKQEGYEDKGLKRAQEGEKKAMKIKGIRGQKKAERRL